MFILPSYLLVRSLRPAKDGSWLRSREYADSLYRCASSSYVMELPRIFLCFCSLYMLCALIAPLPWPHNRTVLYCHCQQAHKCISNEVSYPPGEVGWEGFVIRIIVEANGVVSS